MTDEYRASYIRGQTRRLLAGRSTVPVAINNGSKMLSVDKSDAADLLIAEIAASRSDHPKAAAVTGIIRDQQRINAAWDTIHRPEVLA